MKEQDSIFEFLNLPAEHPFAVAALAGLVSFFLIKNHLDHRKASDILFNPITPNQERFVRYGIPTIAFVGTMVIASVFA